MNEIFFAMGTTFIDLFAGVGGFRYALEKQGSKCVFSSEWDKKAQESYATFHGDVPAGDITLDSTKKQINADFDILCGGFPCQAFSIAGLRKGFQDTRGTLFFDIENIAEVNRPRVLFLENVKNLVTHEKGKTFRTIIEILTEKLGYYVHYKVLNSMTHANIPQNRERIFIVAFDKKQVKNFSKFEFPEEIPLTKTIHDIIDPSKQPDKYYYQSSSKYYKDLVREVTNRNSVYQLRRIYIRENKSNVCPTLTANMGTGGHNVPIIKDDFGIRKLTPKECFGFQGYPIDKMTFPKLADSHLYKQAGNSVTVPLIERISKNILDVIY